MKSSNLTRVENIPTILPSHKCLCNYQTDRYELNIFKVYQKKKSEAINTWMARLASRMDGPVSRPDGPVSRAWMARLAAPPG